MTIDKLKFFEQLTQSLRSMNDVFQKSAASDINKHATCRNWLNWQSLVAKLEAFEYQIVRIGQTLFA